MPFRTSNFRKFSRKLHFSRFDSCMFDTLMKVSCATAKNHATFPFNVQLKKYRQQPLLSSIDIWPVRNSRLAQRELNHYIARCASVLAWSCPAGCSPKQFVVDLFVQHQRFVVCCPWTFNKEHQLIVVMQSIANTI